LAGTGDAIKGRMLSATHQEQHWAKSDSLLLNVMLYTYEVEMLH